MVDSPDSEIMLVHSSHIPFVNHLRAIDDIGKL